MGVQSQRWTGTFTADSTCNRSACCCLNGQIVVQNSTSNMLSVTSGLSGVCGNSTTLLATTTYPSGYTGYLVFGTVNFTLTLSSDSNTISAINPTSSACNGNGIRNSAVKQHGNLMAIVALIFMRLTKFV